MLALKIIAVWLLLGLVVSLLFGRMAALGGEE